MFQSVQYHVKLPTVLAVIVFNLKISAFQDGLISSVLAICLKNEVDLLWELEVP